ncbi:O-antigen ligase family protein [Parvibaculum sp.]|uniref:O-antigen ligase family protein n=1 Tax=Parvibaculum sp. TaxID=2024848 RepID=UPI003210BA37
MNGFAIDTHMPIASAASRWGRRIGEIALFLVIVGSFYQKSKAGESQPVPYDLLLIGCMALFFLLGLKLPRGMAWPALLWGLVLIGYILGGVSAPYMDLVQDALTVSGYQVCAFIFFSSFVYEDPGRRLPLLLNAWAIGGVIVSVIAIAAYFDVMPNADDYLAMGRATGTFNDPNVFGPFLIPPTIYLAQRLSMARSMRALLLAPGVGVLLLGVFLSFSRGAWGSLVLSSAVFLGLTLATSKSARQSMRLIVSAAVMGVLVVGMLAAALSTPQVQALFKERAMLVQDYDVGEQGRFESQKRAFVKTLENPLGLGPNQWAKLNRLDTHNVYLHVLVAGGFLSGLSFIGFVLLTLRRGWRTSFVAGPGQEYLIVAYACVVGHMAEAFIIDIENWRHIYLLFGMIWGVILARKAGGGTRPGSLAHNSRQR